MPAAEMALPMPPLPHPKADSQPEDAGRAAFRMPPVISKRADFLATAKGRRQGTDGFLLQARDRGDDLPARVGFTCSKKVGNAVMRNRAKRRLREIARLHLVRTARPGWDYVLVGRPGATVSRDFAALCDDLSRALRKVHG
ncbi:ribonuclease P protein component [Paracoccus sp. (in: a-proteobacteria)]|uniref:ribonuclease P protein component n=1 Tax=Paracoccus sp. TaxID=267 RepID=UPI003A852F91